MSKILTKIKSKKQIAGLVKAYSCISKLSESELETLEILSNTKDHSIIRDSLKDSKNNKVEPIESLV